MKILFGLSLCLLFTLSQYGQSKNISAINREIKTFKNNVIHYRVVYYDGLDKTVVSFAGEIAPFPSFPKESLIGFNINFGFDGKVLEATNDDFSWTFKGTWSVINDTTVNITADDEHFTLDKKIMDSFTSRKFGSGGFLTFLVERDDLKKFARAKSLEITIFGKSYVLSPKQQQVLKDVLAVSEIK